MSFSILLSLTAQLMPVSTECAAALLSFRYPSLPTERERQLTTARANQTTDLTNVRVANWAPEVEFSPFRALTTPRNTTVGSWDRY